MTPHPDQPLPAFGPLARVPVRGPAGEQLSRLVQRALGARRRDRELTDELRDCRRKLDIAKTELRDAALATDEALADGEKAPDGRLLKTLQRKVAAAQGAVDAAESRVAAFRVSLREREQKAVWFAERHNAELVAEAMPAIAEAEGEVREALAKVGTAFEALGDAVFEVNAVQATVQGAQRVVPGPVTAGHRGVDELLRDVSYWAGVPLLWLPEPMRALAEDTGMMVADPVDRRITVNDLSRLVQRVVVENG